MQDALNYANFLLKDRQDKMQDFIRQTSQNYPKENNQNDLTLNINNDKMETELGKFKSLLKSDEYVDTEYYSALKERFSHASKARKFSISMLNQALLLTVNFMEQLIIPKVKNGKKKAFI